MVSRKAEARQLWGLIGSYRRWDKPLSAQREARMRARARALWEGKKVKTMWRMTLAINYVLHHIYYSMRLQRWANTPESLRRSEKVMEEKLVTALERYLGFNREDWWFPHQIGIGYQEVPYRYGLIGRTEIENEILGAKRR